MSDVTAKLRLTATGGEMTAEVRAVKGAVNELGPAAENAGRRADRSFRTAGDAAAYLASQVEKAKVVAASLAGFAGAKALAQDIIAATSATAGWESSMRAATGS